MYIIFLLNLVNYQLHQIYVNTILFLGLQYIITNKGFKQWVYNGNIFLIKNRSQNFQVWRCQKYFSFSKCKATLKYFEGKNEVHLIDEHNHQPDLDTLSKKIKKSLYNTMQE